MGLLWLADRRPDEASKAIELSKTENVSLSQTLAQKYNLDMCTVGSVLATSMELPEIITSTIGSCALTNNNTDALSKNHRHARQLTASILRHVDSDKFETTNTDIDPYLEQLTKKLPVIASMAQVLFFN